MKTLIVGIVFIAAAVFAVLPNGLGWGADVMAFLRGGLPVAALLIGIIGAFVGIADMKDRAEAKAEAEKEETSPSQ
jgi:hypothetical protein